MVAEVLLAHAVGDTSRYGFVYLWTNIINGKMYVGSHYGHVDDGYVGSGFAFKDAWLVHGAESWIREIIYIGDDYRSVEEKILLRVNARENKMFYNLINSSTGFAPGVEHPMFGKPSALRGTKKAPEFGKAISERMSGQNHPMFGKHHTEESKARIGAANRGKTLSPEHRQKISASHQGMKLTPEQLAPSKVKTKICSVCAKGPFTGKGLGQHFRYNPDHRVVTP